MPRVPVDSLASKFKKNPTKYENVMRIGQGSVGMTVQEARKKFQCGAETVRYYRKVYDRVCLKQDEEKLITIQIPAKILEKVKDQAQRIQFLEANLWRKTEELNNLKYEIEGLKNELQNTGDSE